MFLRQSAGAERLQGRIFSHKNSFLWHNLCKRFAARAVLPSTMSARLLIADPR